MASTTTATINPSIDVSRLSEGANIPKTPINLHFVPTFAGITIYPDIMDTIVNNGIHEQITRHSLKMLVDKGNMSAFDILYKGGTAIIDYTDMVQEVVMALYECRSALKIDGNRLIIEDDGEYMTLNNGRTVTKPRYIYGACNRFLHSFMQKHYKRLYVEVEGQTVGVFNTKALSSCADYEDIIKTSTYKAFIKTVGKKYPKDLKRIEKLVEMRAEGKTYTECAKVLDTSTSTVDRLRIKLSECAKITVNKVNAGAGAGTADIKPIKKDEKPIPCGTTSYCEGIAKSPCYPIVNEPIPYYEQEQEQEQERYATDSTVVIKDNGSKFDIFYRSVIDIDGIPTNNDIFVHDVTKKA